MIFVVLTYARLALAPSVVVSLVRGLYVGDFGDPCYLLAVPSVDPVALVAYLVSLALKEEIFAFSLHFPPSCISNSVEIV